MVEGEASSLPTLVVWSTTCGRVLGKLLVLWFPCSCSVSGMAGSATLARVTVSPPCRGSLGAKPFPGSSISQHLPWPVDSSLQVFALPWDRKSHKFTSACPLQRKAPAMPNTNLIHICELIPSLSDLSAFFFLSLSLSLLSPCKHDQVLLNCNF